MNEVHWQGGGREKPIDHERLIVCVSRKILSVVAEMVTKQSVCATRQGSHCLSLPELAKIQACQLTDFPRIAKYLDFLIIRCALIVDNEIKLL